jgi:hypothetical protein
VKILFYGENKKMDSETSDDSGQDQTEETIMQDLGAASNSVVIAPIWPTEETTVTTGPLLKNDLKHLFVEFLTQLAWGCIINLRVIIYRFVFYILKYF